MDAAARPSEARDVRFGRQLKAIKIRRMVQPRYALIATFLLVCGTPGVPAQRNGGNIPPVQAPTPDYSAKSSNTNLTSMPDIGDPTTRREMEEKRGRMLNVERQRAMEREAGQLVVLAAELQQALAKDPQGPAREEAVHRVDTIEKLARNVKERMKGGR